MQLQLSQIEVFEGLKSETIDLKMYGKLLLFKMHNITYEHKKGRLKLRRTLKTKDQNKKSLW